MPSKLPLLGVVDAKVALLGAEEEERTLRDLPQTIQPAVSQRDTAKLLSALLPSQAPTVVSMSLQGAPELDLNCCPMRDEGHRTVSL